MLVHTNTRTLSTNSNPGYCKVLRYCQCLPIQSLAGVNGLELHVLLLLTLGLDSFRKLGVLQEYKAMLWPYDLGDTGTRPILGSHQLGNAGSLSLQ